ncbi:MAG: hypothetical protein RMN51_00995 [Verrucomicrobiota bacterium]|nr:hypothetical protein [Limisphaera sp.]MDW8380675.1 hypothetical protein [Verrucomicrobiota bacterium]
MRDRNFVRLLHCTLVIAWIASGTVVHSATPTLTENPYAVAAERNIFDLRPMPKPEELAPAPPPPPPTKITLQGITVLFGRKEVLLKIPESPAPGQPPKERSLILGEGERHGPIEVVKIDPITREVEFRDSGNPVKLKLTDFIAKTPAAPAPIAAVPAAPAVVRPTAPPTAGVQAGGPPATAVVASGPTTPGFPSRPVRTPPAAVPSPVPAAMPAPQAPQQPQLSLEEQIVLIELQRKATEQQVQQGLLPPLPPTELTPPTPGGGATPAPPSPMPPVPPVPGP